MVQTRKTDAPHAWHVGGAVVSDGGCCANAQGRRRRGGGGLDTEEVAASTSFAESQGERIRWKTVDFYVLYVFIFILYNTQEYYDVRAVVVKCRSTSSSKW